MSTVLRPARESDRQSVKDIFNHHATHGYAVYRENEMDETIFDFFAKDAHAFLVAEDEDHGVIGFGSLRQFKPAPSFNRTAVLSYFLLPEYTRAGLGTRFLTELSGTAREKGIEQLLVHISSRNEQSIRFHHKHGFEEVGRLANIGVKFGHQFDLVWMQTRCG